MSGAADLADRRHGAKTATELLKEATAPQPDEVVPAIDGRVVIDLDEEISMVKDRKLVSDFRGVCPVMTCSFATQNEVEVGEIKSSNGSYSYKCISTDMTVFNRSDGKDVGKNTYTESVDKKTVTRKMKQLWLPVTYSRVKVQGMYVYSCYCYPLEVCKLLGPGSSESRAKNFKKSLIAANIIPEMALSNWKRDLENNYDVFGGYSDMVAELPSKTTIGQVMSHIRGMSLQSPPMANGVRESRPAGDALFMYMGENGYRVKKYKNINSSPVCVITLGDPFTSIQVKYTNDYLYTRYKKGVYGKPVPYSRAMLALLGEKVSIDSDEQYVLGLMYKFEVQDYADGVDKIVARKPMMCVRQVVDYSSKETPVRTTFARLNLEGE